MAVFNHVRKEIDAKIVYYGPGISGKTTNLQQIHQRLKPEQRGKMISLATNEDRTLFFDFLPIELGSVRGFKTRFHLYTVPGQVYYGATRRAVLTGADGIVFVADSQADRLDDNLVSLEDLQENLKYYGKKIETVPLIIQYNKRDLPNVLSMEQLNAKVNRWGTPVFESVASAGQGVFETLTAVCRLVLQAIENGAQARSAEPARASVPQTAREAAPVSPPRVAESPIVRKDAGAAGGIRASEFAVPGSNQGRAPAVDALRSGAPVTTDPAVEKGISPAGVRREPSVSTEPEREGGPDIRAEKKKKEEGRSLLNWVLNRPNGVKAEEQEEAQDAPGQGSVRIVSCGQPRVSPPHAMEVPLDLEITGAGKTFSARLMVSINLEQFELKAD
jgi:mutual gliding-motility protein MglA